MFFHGSCFARNEKFHEAGHGSSWKWLESEPGAGNAGQICTRGKVVSGSTVYCVPGTLCWIKFLLLPLMAWWSGGLSPNEKLPRKARRKSTHAANARLFGPLVTPTFCNLFFHHSHFSSQPVLGQRLHFLS